MTYLGDIPVLLKGPVSRRIYALTPGGAAVDVDARDTDSFSASRLFARL